MPFKSFLPFTIWLVFLSCGDQEPRMLNQPGDTSGSVSGPLFSASDRTYVPGERIGIITKGVTLEDLEKTYGKASVRAGTLYGAEGITYEGYVLFPDTDDALDLSIDSMGVGANTFNPGSHWTCAEHGIRIGTSLSDLNRLNGRPFTFSGFGWDYGGSPIDFGGGALEGHGFRMNIGNIYEEEIALKFMGDATFSSDAPELEALEIHIDALYMSVE